MVERYRIFAFTTFYRADSMPRANMRRPNLAMLRVAHNSESKASTAVPSIQSHMC